MLGDVCPYNSVPAEAVTIVTLSYAYAPYEQKS